jgi:hypothetical protein
MAKLVRLKPLDAKKGHVIRRLTVFATLFEESKGWYRVSEEMAHYLATMRQVPNDEDTPLAFDVCTQEEGRRIDAAEKKKAEDRARANAPNVLSAREVMGDGGDLTTADLAHPGRREGRPRATVTTRRL